MRAKYTCWVDGSSERRTYTANGPEYAAKHHAARRWSTNDSKSSFDVHVEHNNEFRHFAWVFAMGVKVVLEPYEISRVVTDHHGKHVHQRSEPRPRWRMP